MWLVRKFIITEMRGCPFVIELFRGQFTSLDIVKPLLLSFSVQVSDLARLIHRLVLTGRAIRDFQILVQRANATCVH
jgi:hypothetical protein